jgi:uncharacterized membrane protein
MFFMKKIITGSIFAMILTVCSTDVNAQTTTTHSRARQNTAIGAGVGAVTGAVVSRKKAKGAIIGGVTGGVIGYAWGKHKDRKKGRKVITKN